MSERLHELFRRMQRALLVASSRVSTEDILAAHRDSELLAKLVEHEFSNTTPEPTWNSPEHPRNLPPMRYF